jgi:hypothetical protein
MLLYAWLERRATGAVIHPTQMYTVTYIHITIKLAAKEEQTNQEKTT